MKLLNVEYMWVFIDFEKAYDRVNREALWQVLRMYEVGVNYLVKIRICMLIVYLVCQSKKG